MAGLVLLSRFASHVGGTSAFHVEVVRALAISRLAPAGGRAEGERMKDEG